MSVRVGGGGEEGRVHLRGGERANGTPADRQVSVVVQSVWCVCVKRKGVRTATNAQTEPILRALELTPHLSLMVAIYTCVH